jgi:aminoglycoside phosphotransferase (APT) family kinase protein
MTRHLQLAVAIAETIGVSAAKVREIVDQGEVNHALVLDSTDGKFVLRFAIDPLAADVFDKEAWCANAACEAGVPTAEIVTTGDHDGVRYQLQRFVEGHLADHHRSAELWRTLGRYSRRINEIEIDGSAPDSLFPRFGRDPRENWHRHIAYNLGELHSDDRLLALGVYLPEDRDFLYRTFESMEPMADRFGLAHGDLVPKNVILSPEGAPVVIDWGSASIGAIPFNDCKRIWRDEANEGFGPEALEGFAEGYGIPLPEILPSLQKMWLLGAIDVTRWAIDQRPDLLEIYTQNSRKVVAEARSWFG